MKFAEIGKLRQEGSGLVCVETQLLEQDMVEMQSGLQDQ